MNLLRLLKQDQIHSPQKKYNMKQLLIEHIPFSIAKLTLTESKGNGRMLLQGKLQEAGRKNGNGRIYPPEVLQREVKKYMEGPISQNNAMGELDHPDSSVINLSNLAHNIKKVWCYMHLVWSW